MLCIIVFHLFCTFSRDHKLPTTFVCHVSGSHTFFNLMGVLNLKMFSGENGEPGRVINAGKAITILYHVHDWHFYTFKTDPIHYIILIYSWLQFCGNSWTTRATWTIWTCWTSRTVRWATKQPSLLLDPAI